MDGVTASVSQCVYGGCEPQLECCRTLHLSGKATEEKRAATELKRSPSSSSVTAPFSPVTLSLELWCPVAFLGLKVHTPASTRTCYMALSRTCYVQKNMLEQTQSGVNNLKKLCFVLLEKF